ncbi:MAG: hypothetical protein ACOX2W_00175 [Desulfomonilia bacterium]
MGAGTGATSGKIRGVLSATKAGLGSSMARGDRGVLMGALVVANPFGDVLDEQGRIIAGAREGADFSTRSRRSARARSAGKWVRRATPRCASW